MPRQKGYHQNCIPNQGSEFWGNILEQLNLRKNGHFKTGFWLAGRTLPVNQRPVSKFKSSIKMDLDIFILMGVPEIQYNAWFMSILVFCLFLIGCIIKPFTSGDLPNSFGQCCHRAIAPVAMEYQIDVSVLQPPLRTLDWSYRRGTRLI